MPFTVFWGPASVKFQRKDGGEVVYSVLTVLKMSYSLFILVLASDTSILGSEQQVTNRLTVLATLLWTDNKIS